MFCNNCGREIDDKAYICPSCGCLVQNKTKQINEEKTDSMEKSSKKALVFLTITFITFIFDIIASSILRSIWLRSYGLKSFYYVYYSLAFILSVVFFVFSIIAFIYALKQKNKLLKTLAILVFVRCLAVCVLSCINLFEIIEVLEYYF